MFSTVIGISASLAMVISWVSTCSEVFPSRHITNPTLDKAARLAAIDQFVTAVESGLAVVPEEYRDGVWRHVRYGGRWPIIAARSTWERWERRYLAAVASR